MLKTEHTFDSDTRVYAGLDLSGRTDLTALVIIGKVSGVWQVASYFWTPEKGLVDRAKRDRAPYDLWYRQGYIRTTPGATVDYEFVATEIAEILSGLNVQAVAYDRWRIDLLKKEFSKIGADLPPVEWGHGLRAVRLADADQSAAQCGGGVLLGMVGQIDGDHFRCGGNGATPCEEMIQVGAIGSARVVR